MSQCHDVYDQPYRPFHFPARVEDLMCTDPVTVEPSSTVKEIASVLLRHDIRSVPVIDMGDELVGIVSEADLVCREGYQSARHHSLAGFVGKVVSEHRHRWSERSSGLTAGEVMTREVITCAPEEHVSAVAGLMLSAGIRTVPVVKEGRLVGVISRHDLLRVLDRPDFEVRARIAELLADPMLAPEGHHVDAVLHDGVAILRGTARYPSDIDVIVEEIRQVPGVLEVANRLTAEEPEPRPSLFHDTDWR